MELFSPQCKPGIVTMKRILTLIAILVAAALSLPWTSQAKAQNSISLVSNAGSDANDCRSATACSSFANALAHTSDGGVVSCVDAGYFANFIIIKSVTIDCLAGGGGINTAGVTINAPGKTVRLRNLAVNGAGVFGALIDIIAASQVYIENVIVAANAGGLPCIKDHRAGPAVLVVRDSSIVNCTGPGIVIAPASGAIGVDLENVTSAYNNFGLAVGSGGRVMIKNSFFTNNSTAGIEADGGSLIDVSNSQVAFNSTGIAAGGAITLSNSGINSNSTAINGATQSYGNNRLVGNSSKGTAPTIISGE
jgi:parallel beta helix pectate lyase-like protein